MLAFDVLVRGRVSYEAADGASARIPRGHCRVETHEGFVSLLWIDDMGAHSTTLTGERFEEYLEGGAMLVLDAAQLGRTRAPERS